MRMGVWITLAALALAGCNQDNTNRPAANNSTSRPDSGTTVNKPAIGGGETPATSATPNTGTTASETGEPTRPDNSAVNKRDKDNNTILPTDQGNNQADIDRTAEIRREVLKIEKLSVSGRNVKIVTNDGKVTLRGPVASDAERKAIEDVANHVAGKDHVTSQLEVTP